MLKQSKLLPLLVFTLLAACGKQEPVPVAPQTAAPAPAPVVETPAAPARAPATTPPPASTAAPAAGDDKVAMSDDKGKKVYDSACFACHAAGVAGAPKLGDKANWGPRIAQGNDTLYTHAIKGYQGKAGMMPPKGGNMSLSDDDVKAGVDYMVSKGK